MEPSVILQQFRDVDFEKPVTGHTVVGTGSTHSTDSTDSSGVPREFPLLVGHVRQRNVGELLVSRWC
jgi:hypothetical protein